MLVGPDAGVSCMSLQVNHARARMRKLACQYLVLLQGHDLYLHGGKQKRLNCTFQVLLFEWLL